MPNISSYQNARRMLNRVPDAVILAVATQEMRMGNPRSCLVATVVKEALSAVVGKRIKPDVEFDTAPIQTALRVANLPMIQLHDYSPAPLIAYRMYGGGLYEWIRLYNDADDKYVSVERAFADRVAVAVKSTD